ncbi:MULTISPECIES: hypothetical protein [Marinobacter]|uniref:hypothetical protein n=1 Tax=Marinobacter TaxID=2742 RepID=UPI000DAEB441|nr:MULTISPECIES: hypothetical protein [Marinobacter]
MQWKTPIVVLCLGLAPTLALAEPQTGDRLFTLTGSGSSDTDFDNNTAAFSFDLGQFFTDNTAMGLRQSVGFSDTSDNSSWSGATRLFADYHFDADEWQPFVGANFGGIYGDDVDETFFAGPEAGVKYYVKPKTFITFQTEYQVFFDSASDADDNFDDGAWAYSAGIGFNF